MFTRFKNNVKTYPRTALVLGGFYLSAIVGSYVMGHFMGITTTRQVLTILALVGVILFVDGISYVWFMGSPRRVAFLLELLEDFEGRTTDDADVDGDVCDGCEECDPGYLYASNGREKETCGGTDLIDDERGQDIAEYAVMLAVILAIAIGTIHLIGSSANNVFSQIGSHIQ